MYISFSSGYSSSEVRGTCKSMFEYISIYVRFAHPFYNDSTESLTGYLTLIAAVGIYSVVRVVKWGGEGEQPWFAVTGV